MFYFKQKALWIYLDMNKIYNQMNGSDVMTKKALIRLLLQGLSDLVYRSRRGVVDKPLTLYPWVSGLIPGFSCLSYKTLGRSPVFIWP